MEITLLKVLLKSISSFSQLSSSENTKCEPIQRYFSKTEDVLKLLKPVVEAIINAEVVSNEKLQNSFAKTSHFIDDLRDIFENWYPLMSKVHLVLRAESLILNIQVASLEIFELLESLEQDLPPELSVASLNQIFQKMKQIELERTSNIIMKAVKDQLEGSGASPDSLAKIADCLNLKSNQELLIEAVALDKLKESDEQDEKNGDIDYIDDILSLVTHMHEQLVLLKQSKSCSPVLIPADFCCPLSLELMTDPVIVASGQTYERAFIRRWIDLGLLFCPKTRQPLAHTNLIPNFTVKALIANWCESNNVKLPDPIKSMSLNDPSSLLGRIESGSLRNAHGLTHSRANQSASPESTRILSSSNASGGSRVLHQPSYTRTSSEDSLPGVTENGHEVIDRLSLRGSDDGMADANDRNLNISDHTSPASNGANIADGQANPDHNRSTSVSSMVSRVSQATSSEGNEESSHVVADGNDTSGEVTSQPRPAANSAMPQREPEYPSRLEMRTRHQMWRRPSDRFIPRIVPSAMEPRPDLSEVEARVKKLIEDLKNPSLESQQEATAELRLLARNNMDNRIVISNCGAVIFLVDLLRSEDPKTQENAVTALLNLSINDNNKTAIANADAIEPLIHVLQTGTPEAKENSAATLFSLSVVEDNKIKIGRSGAIQPLVDLLGNGTPRGKKDAATALFNLSILHENKGRIVQAGAVKYLIDLMDPAIGMVDKAVAVLSNLATIPEGRQAIGTGGGIPVLVEVVELGSARGKENAAAALLQLCTNSSRFCSMVLHEGAVPPLVALLQSGSPRAREKAQALLSYFRNQRHGNAGRG
ncbi:ubiquitin-protein ligase [Lithospermum erythrorhizon]|uniref:RING-type E3 ubiquitin transferase n=1 Tax=Lithospermum erythrorhizon TaxID=34254 RepID=A0AAV3PMH8_LITER